MDIKSVLHVPAQTHEQRTAGRIFQHWISAACAPVGTGTPGAHLVYEQICILGSSHHGGTRPAVARERHLPGVLSARKRLCFALHSQAPSGVMGRVTTRRHAWNRGVPPLALSRVLFRELTPLQQHGQVARKLVLRPHGVRRLPAADSRVCHPGQYYLLRPVMLSCRSSSAHST